MTKTALLIRSDEKKTGVSRLLHYYTLNSLGTITNNIN